MYGKFNYAEGAHHCHPAHSMHMHHHYNRFGGQWGGYRRPKHNVPLNVIENNDHYEVHVYALGFAKEDVKIAVTGDVLYITGTRTIADDYKPNFVIQEYPIKSFERMLDLNGAVDTENITAKQEDGVLKITLPKTAAAKKEETEIKVN
jgi:HSP20 family protein